MRRSMGTEMEIDKRVLDAAEKLKAQYQEMLSDCGEESAGWYGWIGLSEIKELLSAIDAVAKAPNCPEISDTCLGCEGLESEIEEIIRVAKDNPRGLVDFLQLNFPKEWGLSKEKHRALLDAPVSGQLNEVPPKGIDYDRGFNDGHNAAVRVIRSINAETSEQPVECRVSFEKWLNGIPDGEYLSRREYHSQAIELIYPAWKACWELKREVGWVEYPANEPIQFSPHVPVSHPLLFLTEDVDGLHIRLGNYDHGDEKFYESSDVARLPWKHTVTKYYPIPYPKLQQSRRGSE